MLRNYGVPKEITMALFDDEVLTEHQCKKILIRDEYLRSSKKGKLTELKNNLADKYCVSTSSVEKYLSEGS